jgi:hypothetical protein
MLEVVFLEQLSVRARIFLAILKRRYYRHRHTNKMLVLARKWAASFDVNIKLIVGDVQSLTFLDDSFDTAVATFVF